MKPKIYFYNHFYFMSDLGTVFHRHITVSNRIIHILMTLIIIKYTPNP